MKDYSVEQGYTFWMITIALVFSMGWMQGSSFAYKNTTNDLTEITELAEKNRHTSIDNMVDNCKSVLAISDRICEERVTNAFITGLELSINATREETERKEAEATK